MMPRPYGVWGVLDRDLVTLPGYGKPADMKEKARKLLAEAGYGPGKPLRVEMVTRHRRLRGHGVLRDERAEAGRHRSDLEAGGDGAVASHGHPRRLPDRGQPHWPRGGRSRRQLLRKLRLWLTAQLQLLLQRAGDEDDRPAVDGAGSRQAARPRGGGAEADRAGRGPAHLGSAPRLLHGVAAREEHGAAPQHLQLRPHAERVAGEVAGPSRPATPDCSRARGA